MGKIKNTDFFKRPVEETPVSRPENTQQHENTPQGQNTPVADGVQKNMRVMQLSKELVDNGKDASRTLAKIGFRPLANEINYLYKKVLDETFTIAFVGEFARGKSTIINHVIGRAILPVGNLPTTALLTRIIGGREEKMTVYDNRGHIVKTLPLCPQSWDGLTADNFGEKEPDGQVVVQVNDEFLIKYHINIIDSPGAGDLESKRAKVIEQCLMSSDAVIIAIDATKPFSLTEISFIKQKLLSKKIPFMAVALTKLDMVNENEREAIIDYAFKKLEQLKIKIPVLVLDDSVTIPGNKYSKIIGADKFRIMALAWLTHNSRRELTEQWLVTNIISVLNVASGILAQQQAIVDAKGDEREKIIAQRNKALAQVKGKWEELRDEINKRCEKCVEIFKSRAKEYGANLTEALQHEVGRVPNAKEWLDEEYAYRVKRELSAISLSLDRFVENQLAGDIRWLNETMTKQFKEIVRVTPEELNTKNDFQPDVNPEQLHLESLKDRSMRNTIAGSALTLGAALLLGASGAAPLILATMGVGTGVNIFSRKSLGKKSELQKQQVQELIAQDIPQLIENATADSAVKIKILYNDIISGSLATETRWMQTQRSLIRQSVKDADEEKTAKKLAQQNAEIERLKKLFMK